MPDDMEMDARRLNEADKQIAHGMQVYLEDGYTWDEFLDRLDEIAENYEIQFDA